MEFLFQIALPLTSTILTCAIGYLFKEFKRQNDEHKKKESEKMVALKAHNEALNTAVLTLCRERLLQSYKYFKHNGCISVQDLDAMSKIYEAYHTLGGNGAVTEVYKNIKKIQLKEGDD